MARTIKNGHLRCLIKQDSVSPICHAGQGGLTEFSPYLQRCLELTFTDGCVLWGARVIIPYQVLQQLHQRHPDILTRKVWPAHMWWPLMDYNIDKEVHLCNSCGLCWPFPWRNVSSDCGLQSKWMDVYSTSSATTQAMVEKLIQCFDVHCVRQ